MALRASAEAAPSQRCSPELTPTITVAPELPPRLHNEFSGKAQVAFVISPAGHVQAPVIVSTEWRLNGRSPAQPVGYNEAILAAVAQWRYPSRRQACRHQVPIEIQFEDPTAGRPNNLIKPNSMWGWLNSGARSLSESFLMDKNSYLIELSESDGADFGRIDFAAQGQEQRVFSAIWALESQVNNGGFVQFFDNEEPDLVSFTPAALREIGAIRCSEIVSRALVFRPDRNSSKSTEHLESLDSEFYGYPDDLTELLFAYVAAHPETFKAPAGA